MNAPRDKNGKPMLLATSSSDGETVIPIAVNPTVHSVNILNGTTGSNLPFVNTQRDGNRATAFWGVSSADGQTPIPIYCDSNGNLLTKST